MSLGDGIQSLAGQQIQFPAPISETKQSNYLGHLAGALAAAQGEFTVIKKDKLNPYYNSYYADLDSVIAATRPSLSKHELAIMQFTTSDVNAKTVTVRTLLVHKSGEFIDNYLTGPGTAKARDGALKFDAQSIGINTTYFRRYAWQSLVGVAAEDDDDGNQASPDPAPEPRQQVAKPSGQGQSRPAAKPAPAGPPKAEIPTGALGTTTVTVTPALPQEPVIINNHQDLPDAEAFKGFLAQCKQLADDLSVAGLTASGKKTVNQKLCAYILKATGTSDPTFKEITKNKWLYLFELVGNIKSSPDGLKALIPLIEGGENEHSSRAANSN